MSEYTPWFPGALLSSVGAMRQAYWKSRIHSLASLGRADPFFCPTSNKVETASLATGRATPEDPTIPSPRSQADSNVNSTTHLSPVHTVLPDITKNQEGPQSLKKPSRKTISFKPEALTDNGTLDELKHGFPGAIKRYRESLNAITNCSLCTAKEDRDTPAVELGMAKRELSALADAALDNLNSLMFRVAYLSSQRDVALSEDSGNTTESKETVTEPIVANTSNRVGEEGQTTTGAKENADDDLSLASEQRSGVNSESVSSSRRVSIAECGQNIKPNAWALRKAKKELVNDLEGNLGEWRRRFYQKKLLSDSMEDIQTNLQSKATRLDELVDTIFTEDRALEVSGGICKRAEERLVAAKSGRRSWEVEGLVSQDTSVLTDMLSFAEKHCKFTQTWEGQVCQLWGDRQRNL